jgi:hypothetical protein
VFPVRRARRLFPVQAANLCPPLPPVDGSPVRRVLPVDLTAERPSALLSEPPTWEFPPRNLPALPSSRRFSPHIPRSSWTPADPRGPHPSGPSVLASGTLTPSPSAFSAYGAVSSFRECGLPCGLCGSLCTLQLVRSGSQPSSPAATLGTGGWLGLTRQGLSPCKKRQASLGALTDRCSSRARAKKEIGRARR